jgi:hypothetical protein
MVSKFGNVHRIVSSEKKRDDLIAQGYRAVEDKSKQSRKKASKKSEEEQL